MQVGSAAVRQRVVLGRVRMSLLIVEESSEAGHA